MENQLIELSFRCFSRIVQADEAKTLKLSPEIRLRIVRNLRLCRGVMEDLQKTRDGLIKTHAMGGATIGPQSAGWEAFQSDYQQVMDDSSDLTLAPVTVADLNTGENEIPLLVIDLLMEIEERV